ncbi:MAG: C39 family peptidase [Clostridium sp.]|jgi:predicted double-glycine peptidase|nr:C39 family peptidase [Clostridium sp.]
MRLKKRSGIGLAVCLAIVPASSAGAEAAGGKYEGSPYFIDGDSGGLSESAIDFNDLDAAIDEIRNDSRLSLSEKSRRIDKINLLRPENMPGGSGYAATQSLPNAASLCMVPVFTQETAYYCGPATVKQTLTYINGSAPSQSVIEGEIGTTSAGSVLQYMLDYINEEQDENIYVIVHQPSEQAIQTMVYNAVLHSAPAICRVAFSASFPDGSWKYSTNGHYMNANGYSGYGAEILVTDPNIINVDPNETGYCWVTLTELHAATQNHFAKEMAY